MRVAFVALSDPFSPYSPPVAALSAAARASGHETVFVGLPANTLVLRAAEVIAAQGCDVLAVTMMSRDWPGVRSLLSLVRALTEAFIVVGGYHATLAPREVAEHEAIDAIGVGEGEAALPRLLDRLAAGAAGESFPGMWIRGSGGFADPIPGPDPVRDVGALPAWDYDVLGGVDALLARGVNIFGGARDRFLPTRASRGCPYSCTYCSAPRWGAAAGYDAAGARNVRPVDALCEELASLRDHHHPDGFELWDEHFPIDGAWLAELSREYPRRVGLPFRVEMHPSAATRGRIELLAAAGCTLLHCGVEAGDPDYRRAVLRRHPGDDALARVFEDARALGVATSASVMVGSPGETVRQVEATLALLRRLAPDHLFWSNYQPLPGTALGDEAIVVPPSEVLALDDRGVAGQRIDPRCLPPAALSELGMRFDALAAELDSGRRNRLQGSGGATRA